MNKYLFCFLVLTFSVVTGRLQAAEVEFSRGMQDVRVSNGTNYTRLGNTMHGSDGSRYTQIGNTTYGSDGTRYTAWATPPMAPTAAAILAAAT